MTVALLVKQAVRDGLVDLFGGLADFNGATRPEWQTEVHYGWPFGSTPAEVIFFGTVQAETPPAALRSGRNFRNESGEFEIVIYCAAVGGNAEDSDERAHAHRVQVEDWIADRKSNELGVDGLTSITTRGWRSTPGGNDNGHFTEIRITVQWTARLT